MGQAGPFQVVMGLEGAFDDVTGHPLVFNRLRFRARGATVATGRFGARMQVTSVNDGPFTLLLEV